MNHTLAVANSKPMVKKKFPMADVHLNSSILLQMDEKQRLRSEHMKKFIHSSPTEKQKIKIVRQMEKAPAGSKSGLVQAHEGREKGMSPPEESMHLNRSRRRILNDFISYKPDERSADKIGNRNYNSYLADRSGSQERNLG